MTKDIRVQVSRLGFFSPPPITQSLSLKSTSLKDFECFNQPRSPLTALVSERLHLFTDLFNDKKTGSVITSCEIISWVFKKMMSTPEPMKKKINVTSQGTKIKAHHSPVDNKLRGQKTSKWNPRLGHHHKSALKRALGTTPPSTAGNTTIFP